MAVSASQCIHETNATPYQFEFESGASWEMCWHIDEQAGLVISDVHFAAPLEQSRQLLDSASIGQILFKYDEDTDTSHLLSDPGLGGEQFVSAGVDDCTGGELLAGTEDLHVCQRVRDANLLTKVRRVEALRRHEVSLHARSFIGTHLFEQVWRFSEDGELIPSMVFSGSMNRFTNDARFGVKLDSSGLYASSAVMLVNWRLDFNIDGTENNDQIDEIEFLNIEPDKRPISVSALTTETSRNSSAEQFRGWRISDAEVSSGEESGPDAISRIGYYFDPQGAGYRYNSADQPWSAFDFFVSVKDECEQLASDNQFHHNGCADSLDGFVNDQPLHNADVVTWFSLSRHFVPRLEDQPVISSREIGFTLVPFNWSARSPFDLLVAPDPATGGQ